MTHAPGRHQAYLAIGVIVMGCIMAFQIAGMSAGAGYARIGPQFFPSLIAAGLILSGAALLFKSLRSPPAVMDADEVEAALPPAAWRGFILASAALIAHMALIGSIGFTLAAWLLCYGVCRALDTQRPVRDLFLSLGLALALFHIFKLLGVALPALVPGVF